MQSPINATAKISPHLIFKFVNLMAVFGLLGQVFGVQGPALGQNALTVCGAETGRVYLRARPSNASQNANRTLRNGTPVQGYEYRNGFVFVETANGSSGWVTERYLCGGSPVGGSPAYICGAETGRVYLRARPSNASQNANRTLSNGTAVSTEGYSNGFFLVETMNGMRGWVTERYVCP
ncbi:SH3 domain-containing protein [Synechocystis sp. PCC 7339]|uniref:SH3 domain-containing protein n=1 Tax=unclassified Synechocystis TaxID=2640012 RepID=UPI001BB0157B|nr:MULTISPECIES: SH3 domain-containing protein [unclassified Synechocystis]QUS61687.1 SH3 domain-containing protein [Synechocystis sp. PCC 7338]UAJ73885.1 SH3 domain-containing protein [Synechocystis sp. PCC 7339]